MAAPPVLVIFPVRVTDVLVVAPLDNVRVGALIGGGVGFCVPGVVNIISLLNPEPETPLFLAKARTW